MKKRVTNWIVSVVLVASLLINVMPLYHANAAHVHTDDCYLAGCSKHSHTKSCAEWSYQDYGEACPVCNGTGDAGCSGVWQFDKEETTSSYGSCTYTTYNKCSACGERVVYKTVGVSTSDGSYTSTYYGGTSFESRRPHKCTACGGTGSYFSYYYSGSGNYNYGGGKHYPHLTCTLDAVNYYDENGDIAAASCDKVVTSLTPVSPTQTIPAGNTPNVQAVATFLDGSSKTVTCNYTGFDGTKYSTAQSVTLSYGDYNGTAKNAGAMTTTISVTVKGYFNLSVSSEDTNKGTVAGGGTILTGNNTTVTATPKSGYVFDGWYEGAVKKSSSASYTFVMPAKDVALVAKFVAVPVALEVVASPEVVYNGNEPSYTVSVTYSDGRNVVVGEEQYVKSGFSRGAGTKVVTFTYTEGGITVSDTVTITVLRNKVTCPHGHTYELNDFDVDYGCPTCYDTLVSITVNPTEQVVSLGDTPTFLVIGTYMDGHTGVINGWTTDFNPDTNGVQYVTVSYEGFSQLVVVRVAHIFICPRCSTGYEALEDLSDPGCPECRKTCVSLRVTPTSLFVEQGFPMDITVTATFRDGHEAVVTDWTSNYQPFAVGLQQVTILYGGQAAIVNVTVVAKKADCINCGREYDPTVGGCPVCGDILNGVRATTRGGTNTVVRGIRPIWSVFAIYLDGHEEPVEGGYSVTGLDVYRLGVQNVTVRYEGFSCIVVVEVVDGIGKNVCVNGHVYDLNADGSDPGCPYCTVDADDKPKRFYTITYNNDVVDRLYRDGIYYLQKGDSVTITVKRKKEPTFSGFLDWFFMMFRRDTVFECGGTVE